jgi:hypothetical protein
MPGGIRGTVFEDTFTTGSPMKADGKKIQHLYLRAGFGATPAEWQTAGDVSTVVDRLFRDSELVHDLDFIAYPLKRGREASGLAILKMIVKSRRQLEDLNIVWLNRMASGHAMLREKMTFFWHNHFATSVPFGYLMQVQNNTLRKHALGKFGDMLHAVSRDPAMILYLNNQQNRKGAPNENFAREVMELFTLGEGHFSETDIKEAARAFTGWTVNREGKYVFEERRHDDGEKEFLGARGPFNGDDIIDQLLAQRRTAEFVVTKIYRAFVNDTPVPSRVDTLARDFFDSGYDIGALMHAIFTADWFYDGENTGNIICSPVELLVRLKRTIDLQFEDDTILLRMQRALGQVLFFPPNVAGWKGGPAWIDSSTLLLRLSLAQSILHKGTITFNAKPAFEDRPREPDDKAHKLLTDWSLFTQAFAKTQESALQDTLEDYLLQCDTGRVRPAEELHHPTDGTAETRIIKTAAYLMSLPEYQLV